MQVDAQINYRIIFLECSLFVLYIADFFHVGKKKEACHG
ncbi:hypothetical protein SAMN06265368_4450 [Cohaesibacter gelatinilyticus]|uniref:Uncharacterized protein n=1 Tax=Cohaesibacter gelatinilyticus TaxID=372072 RepID=A0A285PJ73_9HYPH|nr:hypothetical protein SAMN06265368_4450 [Cohaesibacter gelatinilyticus]